MKKNILLIGYVFFGTSITLHVVGGPGEVAESSYATILKERVAKIRKPINSYADEGSFDFDDAMGDAHAFRYSNTYCWGNVAEYDTSLLSPEGFSRSFLSIDSFIFPINQQGKKPDTRVQKISDKMGYGLVAHEFIPKGTLIENYIGEFQSSSSIDSFCNNRYVVAVDRSDERSLVINAEKVGNKARFANHSYCPNAELVRCESLQDGFIAAGLVSCSDIQPGEQILWNYGTSYWESLGVVPEELYGEGKKLIFKTQKYVMHLFSFGGKQQCYVNNDELFFGDSIVYAPVKNVDENSYCIFFACKNDQEVRRYRCELLGDGTLYYSEIDTINEESGDTKNLFADLESRFTD